MSIRLPNLLMIPFLSVVYSTIKICGGIEWDWAVTIVIAPMLSYVGWSISFVMMVWICSLVCRSLDGKGGK